MKMAGDPKAAVRRALLVAAIVAFALAGTSSAFAGDGPVELKVVDRETGRELPVWRHHGRLFIAGEPGARYGLRLTNHTDGRVLLVLSVDGVNILSGETAGYDQRGYVLDAYASCDVNGWRKSESEVAAFTFAPLPQSYAARTGRPVDVGVIGMAVFGERVAPATPYLDAPAGRAERRALGQDSGERADGPPPPLPLPAVRAPAPEAASNARSSSLAAIPAPSPTAPARQRRDERLGTAHGAREWSVATLTTFERASPRPLATRQIEYDTYARLVARGVAPPYPYAQGRPRPFPLQPDPAGFVPDPPRGW